MLANNKTKKMRVRYPPSPTGSPHIGNLRAALFNYLAAKHYKGTFIFRVEDTDKKREVEGGVEKLKDMFIAYDMMPDEGFGYGGEFGPYIQSERRETYDKYAKELMDKDGAYYCFCTEERLAEMREQQIKKGMTQTRYDGLCRKLTKEEAQTRVMAGEEHVIRLKVPEEGICEFDDFAFGHLKIPYKSIDDQVLMKRNGLPTYHFAVVIDDHLMEITHVMRGSEYVSSTPKDVLMYQLFGWKMPQWVHMPLVVGDNGKKLSKRHGALGALQYIEEGYLPDAILNFIALLGWNPGDETTVMSREELVNKFTLERMQKSPAKFDQTKFLWLNGEHMRLLSDKKFEEIFRSWLEKYGGINLDREFVKKMLDDKGLEAKLALVKERSKTLVEAATQLKFFYYEPNEEDYKNSGIEKVPIEVIKEIIGVQLETIIKDQKTWESRIRGIAVENNLNAGATFMQLRVGVTGSRFSPPLRESLEILGEDEVKERMGTYLSL